MRKERDREGERKKEKGLEENCERIHLNSQKAKLKNKILRVRLTY